MDYMAEEFKKANPKYKDLEGNELWDAMTNHVLRQQDGEEIIKTTLPFWRKYILRWLFYRKTLSMTLPIVSLYNWIADKRCNKCKRGMSMTMGFIVDKKIKTFCMHCSQECHPEPNTNLSHRVYKMAKWISKLFWTILDKIHLVRSSTSGRYELFGDEAHYVAFWKTDKDWKMTPVFKSRKWWEYIFITKR